MEVRAFLSSFLGECAFSGDFSFGDNVLSTSEATFASDYEVKEFKLVRMNGVKDFAELELLRKASCHGKEIALNLILCRVAAKVKNLHLLQQQHADREIYFFMEMDLVRVEFLGKVLEFSSATCLWDHAKWMVSMSCGNKKVSIPGPNGELFVAENIQISVELLCSNYGLPLIGNVLGNNSLLNVEMLKIEENNHCTCKASFKPGKVGGGLEMFAGKILHNAEFFYDSSAPEEFFVVLGGFCLSRWQDGVPQISIQNVKELGSVFEELQRLLGLQQGYELLLLESKLQFNEMVCRKWLLGMDIQFGGTLQSSLDFSEVSGQGKLSINGSALVEASFAKSKDKTWQISFEWKNVAAVIMNCFTRNIRVLIDRICSKISKIECILNEELTHVEKFVLEVDVDGKMAKIIYTRSQVWGGAELQLKELDTQANARFFYGLESYEKGLEDFWMQQVFFPGDFKKSEFFKLENKAICLSARISLDLSEKLGPFRKILDLLHVTSSGKFEPSCVVLADKEWRKFRLAGSLNDTHHALVCYENEAIQDWNVILEVKSSFKILCLEVKRVRVELSKHQNGSYWNSSKITNHHGYLISISLDLFVLKINNLECIGSFDGQMALSLDLGLTSFNLLMFQIKDLKLSAVVSEKEILFTASLKLDKIELWIFELPRLELTVGCKFSASSQALVFGLEILDDSYDPFRLAKERLPILALIFPQVKFLKGTNIEVAVDSKGTNVKSDIKMQLLFGTQVDLGFDVYFWGHVLTNIDVNKFKFVATDLKARAVLALIPPFNCIFENAKENTLDFLDGLFSVKTVEFKYSKTEVELKIMEAKFFRSMDLECFAKFGPTDCFFTGKFKVDWKILYIDGVLSLEKEKILMGYSTKVLSFFERSGRVEIDKEGFKVDVEAKIWKIFNGSISVSGRFGGNPAKDWLIGAKFAAGTSELIAEAENCLRKLHCKFLGDAVKLLDVSASGSLVTQGWSSASIDFQVCILGISASFQWKDKSSCGPIGLLWSCCKQVLKLLLRLLLKIISAALKFVVKLINSILGKIVKWIKRKKDPPPPTADQVLQHALVMLREDPGQLWDNKNRVGQVVRVINGDDKEDLQKAIDEMRNGTDEQERKAEDNAIAECAAHRMNMDNLSALRKKISTAKEKIRKWENDTTNMPDGPVDIAGIISDAFGGGGGGGEGKKCKECKSGGMILSCGRCFVHHAKACKESDPCFLHCSKCDKKADYGCEHGFNCEDHLCNNCHGEYVPSCNFEMGCKLHSCQLEEKHEGDHCGVLCKCLKGDPDCISGCDKWNHPCSPCKHFLCIWCQGVAECEILREHEVCQECGDHQVGKHNMFCKQCKSLSNIPCDGSDNCSNHKCNWTEHKCKCKNECTSPSCSKCGAFWCTVHNRVGGNSNYACALDANHEIPSDHTIFCQKCCRLVGCKNMDIKVCKDHACKIDPEHDVEDQHYAVCQRCGVSSKCNEASPKCGLHEHKVKCESMKHQVICEFCHELGDCKKELCNHDGECEAVEDHDFLEGHTHVTFCKQCGKDMKCKVHTNGKCKRSPCEAEEDDHKFRHNAVCKFCKTANDCEGKCVDHVCRIENHEQNHSFSCDCQEDQVMCQLTCFDHIGKMCYHLIDKVHKFKCKFCATTSECEFNHVVELNDKVVCSGTCWHKCKAEKLLNPCEFCGTVVQGKEDHHVWHLLKDQNGLAIQNKNCVCLLCGELYKCQAHTHGDDCNKKICTGHDCKRNSRDGVTFEDNDVPIHHLKCGHVCVTNECPESKDHDGTCDWKVACYCAREVKKCADWPMNIRECHHSDAYSWHFHSECNTRPCLDVNHLHTCKGNCCKRDHQHECSRCTNKVNFAVCKCSVAGHDITIPFCGDQSCQTIKLMKSLKVFQTTACVGRKLPVGYDPKEMICGRAGCGDGKEIKEVDDASVAEAESPIISTPGNSLETKRDIKKVKGKPEVRQLNEKDVRASLLLKEKLYPILSSFNRLCSSEREAVVMKEDLLELVSAQSCSVSDTCQVLDDIALNLSSISVQGFIEMVETAVQIGNSARNRGNGKAAAAQALRKIQEYESASVLGGLNGICLGDNLELLLDEELGLLDGDPSTFTLFGAKYLSQELLTFDTDLFVKSEGGDPLYLYLDAPAVSSGAARAVIFEIARVCVQTMRHCFLVRCDDPLSEPVCLTEFDAYSRLRMEGVLALLKKPLLLVGRDSCFLERRVKQSPRHDVFLTHGGMLYVDKTKLEGVSCFGIAVNSPSDVPVLKSICGQDRVVEVSIADSQTEEGLAVTRDGNMWKVSLKNEDKTSPFDWLCFTVNFEEAVGGFLIWMFPKGVECIKTEMKSWTFPDQFCHVVSGIPGLEVSPCGSVRNPPCGPSNPKVPTFILFPTKGKAVKYTIKAPSSELMKSEAPSFAKVVLSEGAYSEERLVIEINKGDFVLRKGNNVCEPMEYAFHGSNFLRIILPNRGPRLLFQDSQGRFWVEDVSGERAQWFSQ